ncbi:MAG: DUF2871 family protein [Candidatus Marinimicrobia bacterium]|nr:DUF2871 family protein [Candidatus Neomarinimicrobiota bacterium]MCF7840083.1 DUF2871 family protein [Candidatus Neomarinimicrobiota bacterium]MCF7903315.1 DUF2871 family protein [Candidatus Neomarinimicrobiota bacterium]
MFSTVRYFIKTSFVFFIIGFLAGLYMYGAKTFGWPYTMTLVTAHTHVLLVGGMMMMILGVAVWFFPRPKKEDTKYDPDRVQKFYWIFTISTLGRFVFEIFMGIWQDDWIRVTAFALSALQVIGMIGLIYSVWDRVRPVGSQIREKKGEKF